MRTRIPVIIALVFLMMVSGCSLVRQSPNGDPANERYGSTSGNVVNGGLMGGDADWVFYRSESDHWRLYKARHDGTDRQKVCDDIPAYINVLGGWVYYANFADGLKMYKIKVDGTKRTRLTSCTVHHINVTDATIYYVNGDNTDAEHIDLPYAMKADGSKNRLISQVRCSELVYSDGWLYFVSSAKGTFPVFRMKPDGQEMTQLNETYSHFVNIQGESVFYWDVDSGRLRRMKTDGSENVALTETSVDHVNASGEWVYYSNAGDMYNLYRIKTDGSANEKLTDLPPDEPEQPSHSPNNVCVIGGHVYYRAYHSEAVGDTLFSVALDGSGAAIWDR